MSGGVKHLLAMNLETVIILAFTNIITILKVQVYSRNKIIQRPNEWNRKVSFKIYGGNKTNNIF